MNAAPSHLDVASRWGLLPVAIALAVLAAVRLGAIAFAGEPPRARALFAMVGSVAMIVVGVRVMGALGLITQDALFICLCAVVIALLVFGRSRKLGVAWSGLFTGETHVVTFVATVALAASVCAAYFLPVWQWDALGYHLPYVNFALQHGTLADVPADVPYLSTYPHATELYFTGWRAMLPDDRLVDAAQIPLGLIGAAAVACIAIEIGARRDHAVAAGLLWLTLPAVFLQLPTNYVDVASASFLLAATAFVIARPTVACTLAAAVALGLYLGTKPSAPTGTVLVFAVLAVRGWRGGRRGSLVLAAAIVLVIGGESYITNLVHHGNPVWPVRVALGPFELPGTLDMQELLDSGAAAPRLHGPIWKRVCVSWITLDAPPVFDMRYGGLGPVFLIALPFAIVTAVRRRALSIGVIAVAMLASPDPAVPRYVLAFPGLVLALASVFVTRAPKLPRRAVFVLAAGAAALTLVRVRSGLTGEGPALTAYAEMTESERLRAVGANGSTRPWYDALERLGPNDKTVFDRSMELPYLAWPPDLSRPAIRLPDQLRSEEAQRVLADPHVRLLIVDGSSPVGTEAFAHPNEFTPLFRCRSSSCVAFFRN